jgi:hypothetical protein
MSKGAVIAFFVAFAICAFPLHRAFMWFVVKPPTVEAICSLVKPEALKRPCPEGVR